jgi:hypothetical protein
MSEDDIIIKIGNIGRTLSPSQRALCVNEATEALRKKDEEWVEMIRKRANDERKR